MQLVYGKILILNFCSPSLFRISECAMKRKQQSALTTFFVKKSSRGNLKSTLISYIKREFFQTMTLLISFLFNKNDFSLTVTDGYRKT